jgi:putative endonuclease
MEALGKYGEDLAVTHLKKKGWIILGRNIAQKFGEIDILVREPRGTLVFLEVKTLSSSIHGNLEPEDHVTRSKLLKMSRMAEAFSNANPQLVHERNGWRIDVLAISVLDCQSDERIEFRHYENV